jgi:hypothetical protein
MKPYPIVLAAAYAVAAVALIVSGNW